MPRYCLDANVFIQAKNGPYGMDIVPAFWDFLDHQADAGLIYSPNMVYKELGDGDDELAYWVHERRDSNLFSLPNEEIQQIVHQIADHVVSQYPEHNAQLFLEKADPWVIAHAKIDNAVVVTHEKPVPENSGKVKIPNICKEFDVDYLGPYQMLRVLGARFTLS